MIDPLGDPKRWLLEDLCIYSFTFLLCLSWDWLVNLSYVTGLVDGSHEPFGHPYSLGGIQVVGLVFALSQGIRKAVCLKYYG